MKWLRKMMTKVCAWCARCRQKLLEGDLREIASAFRYSLLFILLFETLSFLGQIYPTFSSGAFLILVALAVVLAFVRFDLAFLMLLAELFIGSQGGYLVAYGTDIGIDVSLRLGLFLAVFTVWLAKTAAGLLHGAIRHDLREPEWLASMRRARLFWPFAALLAVFAWGVVRGVMTGNNFGNVFFDANGYAFFALYPVFIVALAERRTVLRGLGLLGAAVVLSVLKALFVLYIFSHRMLTVAPSIYVWVRDTRVGEITRMTGDFYRVFFQSHLYALLGLFAAAAFLLYARSWKDRPARWLPPLIGWSASAMFLSLSRSFWFGAFFGALALVAAMVWGHASARVWKRLVAVAGVAVVAGVLIIAVIYAIPFPRKGAAVSFSSLFGERAMSLSDAAANSRWALLPELTEAAMKHPLLGSGLGTTVTYTTSDPRLLSTNPTGEYTTFAFEWGYHDLWLKFGLIGLAIYLWFLWSIAAPLLAAVRGCRKCFRGPSADAAMPPEQSNSVLALGLLAGLIALLATNVFSPYLNHPLGIGLFMILGAIGANRLLAAE